MPLPKEYLEARTKLGKILGRPIKKVDLFSITRTRTQRIELLKKLQATKCGPPKLLTKIQDPTGDPRIDEILGLKGKGWVLAIASPKGKNRRVIWEADND